MAASLSFSRLPQEVLDEVAYLLGSDNFYGPPSSLMSLVLTSRHLYSRLSFRINHHMYARIFRFKFDIAAAEARFGSDRLTSWALADELRRRCIVLKRLRARTDSTTTARHASGGGGESTMSLRDVLFTAYILVLENDGKNIAQLENYGRIHDWICEFWFDSQGSSLAIYSMRTGGWPFDRIETALGMWLFWFMLKPEDYWMNTGSTYSESPLGLLKAMAFGAHTFQMTTQSWIQYDPRPTQQHNYFTLYSKEIDFTPTPLATPAILSFFSLYLASGPGRSLSTDPRLPPLPHRTWKEYVLEWSRCLGNPKRRFMECFDPGSIEGVWEGFFSYTDFEAYASLLTGASPHMVQRSNVGKHKQTWKLREYYLLSTDPCGSDSGIDIDEESEDNAPLPDGDPIRAYLPTGTHLRETREGAVLQLLNSGQTFTYQSLKQYRRSKASVDVEIRDIVIMGEGHSAWGQFQLMGRIRPCDGLMSLSKTYTTGGRGQWLYRSYLVGNENGILTGRWRDTLTPVENLGYEGCFIMCRRH